MPMIDRTNASGIIPVEEVNTIIEGVRHNSVAMQLMRRLPNLTSGTANLPVLSMLPIADFVNGDSGMKVTTNAAWEKKLLVVGEIAAIIPVPQAVFDDARYDIWGQVRPLLVEAFGRVFDRQVFSTVNPKAPAQWPQPIIPAAIAAGNTVALGTGVDVAEDINQLFGMVEADSYNVTGVAAQIALKTNLRGLRNSNGTPIYTEISGNMPATIYGVPSYFVPSGTWDATQALAIAGDWMNAVYAIRQDMTFDVFTQGVISDDAGAVVYNLIQQDMIAMRAVMRLAWQIANPIDIDRPTTGAFPFAVLQPAVGP